MTELLFKKDRCYRPDEIATALNISEKTVHRMIKDVNDPLPAYRPAFRVLRVHGADLVKYLEGHKVEPENE